MDETDKQKDPVPTKSNGRISRFISRIQHGLSKLLLSLPSLLRAPDTPKEAGARFAHSAGTYVDNMSRARFLSLITVLSAVIIIVTFLCLDPFNWFGYKCLVSPTISGICFSEMENGETNGNYLKDDVSTVIKLMKRDLVKLNLFKELVFFDPNSTGPNEIVVNIVVGCYKTKIIDENELKIKIEENGGKVRPSLSVSYSNPIKSMLSTEDIVERIRKRILIGYPPQGSIQRLYFDPPPSEGDPGKEYAVLDVGSHAGVRKEDLFNVLSPNKKKKIGTVKVEDVLDTESTAEVTVEKEEIKEKCCVEWVLKVGDK